MTEFDPAHQQGSGRVRFDWGPTGATAIATGADVAVVIDVLSFTTTLTVALERGITVYPYRWHDDGAATYAAERNAVVAVGRLEQRSRPGTVSLSPSAMAAATGVERIVLPSPNGSSIAVGLSASGALVVGACLRNASAVGRWLATQAATGAVVAVVAAGERWPDGSLRPGVEDLWGAGAVLSALAEHTSADDFTPEARQAMNAFRQLSGTDLRANLRTCASARELVAAGFEADVDVASETDATSVVPLLNGDAFVPADPQPCDAQHL